MATAAVNDALVAGQLAAHAPTRLDTTQAGPSPHEEADTLALSSGAASTFGSRNYLELFSVFSTLPLFTVLHGTVDLGRVHHSSFQAKEGQLPILLLDDAFFPAGVDQSINRFFALARLLNSVASGTKFR